MFLNVWFYISVVLLVLLIVSIYYAYKFAVVVLNVQEALERSLDILDNRYRAISEILEKPIFFDSLEVRQCVSEIKKSRDAILYIANVMTDPLTPIPEESKLIATEENDGS